MSTSLRSQASVCVTKVQVRSAFCALVTIALMLTLPACSRSGDLIGLDPNQSALDFGNKTGGEAGGTVTIYGNQIGAVRPFLKSGLSGDFSNQHSASFQNIGAVTKGTGTATLSRDWTVPLLAGLSFPAGVPNLTAQIYGGAEITHNKAGFSLTEGGAPAGAPTIASDTWTSFDPAIGAALLYEVGQINGLPVNLGPSVTVSWNENHTVIARSANFAAQTYILETGNRTDTRLLLNLNVAINPMLEVGAAGGATW